MMGKDQIKQRSAQLLAPVNYEKGITSILGRAPEDVIIFPCFSDHSPDRRSPSIEKHPPYLIPFFCFNICLETAGNIMVEDNIFHLRPGQGILIFPFQAHILNFDRDRRNWLFISFQHDENILAELRDQPFELTGDSEEALAGLLDRYLAWQKSTNDSGSEIPYRLGLLLIQLLENTLSRRLDFLLRTHSLSAKHQQIQNICRFIYQHMHEDLSLSRISEHMKMSESHLKRQFQEIAGISLGRFIRRARILQATSLLNYTDLNIQQIAQRVGFDSPFTFSRCFKNICGDSPSHYRKQLLDSGFSSRS